MSKSGAILAVALPIAIIGVLGVGGWMVLGELSPEAEMADELPKGLAVFTEPVRRDDLQLTVQSQGEVRPRREISISPQISGRISYVSPAFIDGGFVRRGDVLVRVDDADYQLSRVRAQSQVASAEQRLARERAETELALQDLEAEAKSGLDVPNLRVIADDPRSKASYAVRLAQDFITNDNAKFFCGIVSSGVAHAVSDLAKNEKIIMVGTDHASSRLSIEAGFFIH